MKVDRGAFGWFGILSLATLAACSAHASTWTVSFDPVAPVHTNGWDLSQSKAQEKTTQSPAGRKLAPENKGDTTFIESPIHSSRIRAVSLAFKCVGVKVENSSKVEVLGRAATDTDYQILFSEPRLPGSPTNLCSSSYVTSLAEFDCRQVKIAYTKDSGNLIVSSVTFEDDAICAETPTNLRTTVADAEARRVCVSWDLADGLSESEWRTFTTAAVGGIDDSETLWRETFDGVSAMKTATKIEASDLPEFGLADGWEGETLRQPTTTGALLVGWGESATGSLTTPPLGQDFAAGHVLVLNAAARDAGTDSKPGILPVSVVAGAVTSCVAEVAITKTPRDVLIPLPALAATDRIQILSLTNYAQRATLVYDLAICAPGAYQPEAVVTNACSDVTAAAEPSATLTVPADGTNLWLEVRTVYESETSAWTEPFQVTLVDSESDDESDDGTGDGDATDGESGGKDVTDGEDAAETGKCVVLSKEDSAFAFSVDDLTATSSKWDVSESPFRFFLEGKEQSALTSRNATTQIQKGLYVCTNVFEKNWAVLVPGAPEKVSELHDAECRLTIRTDAFAVRRLELSADFAQLYAGNSAEKGLALQYRTIALDGSPSDWTTLGDYKSTYTSADASPDLAGTRTNVTCAANVRLPRGATVEARVYCRKEKDSGREAPLGFRDFRVRILGLGPPLLYVIR